MRMEFLNQLILISHLDSLSDCLTRFQCNSIAGFFLPRFVYVVKKNSPSFTRIRRNKLSLLYSTSFNCVVPKSSNNSNKKIDENMQLRHTGIYSVNISTPALNYLWHSDILLCRFSSKRNTVGTDSAFTFCSFHPIQVHFFSLLCEMQHKNVENDQSWCVKVECCNSSCKCLTFLLWVSASDWYETDLTWSGKMMSELP